LAWEIRSRIFLSCCTDGLRPASFKIERIDTKSFLDVSGIDRPAPIEVYDSERWGEFSYKFTGLKSGKNYRVRLHLCEVFHSGSGRRLFNVNLGEKPILKDYDILAETGRKYKAVVKEFNASADNSGCIVIDFVKGLVDFPKISAIEIIDTTEGSKGKTVYAVNTGGQACGSYSADNYFSGGNA
jgi:hypothetical protein